MGREELVDFLHLVGPIPDTNNVLLHEILKMLYEINNLNLCNPFIISLLSSATEVSLDIES